MAHQTLGNGSGAMGSILENMELLLDFIDLKALFTHLSLNAAPLLPQTVQSFNASPLLPQNTWLKITLPKNLALCGQGCDAGEISKC